ncbi:MAG: hypothetical protein M0C28_17320 [Candidatus Moduliflexus flocculans]|nr:hypothetical protein [Candidatus Moduliflexus flocculans]
MAATWTWSWIIEADPPDATSRTTSPAARMSRCGATCRCCRWRTRAARAPRCARPAGRRSIALPRLAREAGPAAAVAQRREPQPDRLLQGPRQRRGGGPGPRDRRRGGGHRLHRQRRGRPGGHGRGGRPEGGHLRPETAPPAKVAQLLVFGAQVILVDGTYDEAFDLTIEAAQRIRLVLPQHGLQPLHRRRQEDRRL